MTMFMPPTQEPHLSLKLSLHKRERGLFCSFCLLFDHLALASPFAQHGPPIIVARLLNFTPELLIYLAFYGKKIGPLCNTALSKADLQLYLESSNKYFVIRMDD